MREMMTESELENLVSCYINVEGYTDARPIFIVMKQEYPGEFDSKMAMKIIRETLSKER